ncbi:hypothetical protein GJ496_004447 [Pomphorhynchus laevis]|nr:hypothetical protein GJ496_004447 [Pomphorhynchus laevis]
MFRLYLIFLQTFVVVYTGCDSVGSLTTCANDINVTAIPAHTISLHLANVSIYFNQKSLLRFKQLSKLQIDGSNTPGIASDSYVELPRAVTQIILLNGTNNDSFQFLRSLSTTAHMIEVLLFNVQFKYQLNDVISGLKFSPISFAIVDMSSSLNLTDIDQITYNRMANMKKFVFFKPTVVCSEVCEEMPRLRSVIVSKGFDSAICLLKQFVSSNASNVAYKYGQIARACPGINRCKKINNFGQIGTKIGSGVELVIRMSSIMATPDNYELEFLEQISLYDSELFVDKTSVCKGYPNLYVLTLTSTSFTDRFISECLIRPLHLTICNYSSNFSLDFIGLLKPEVVVNQSRITIEEKLNDNFQRTKPSAKSISNILKLHLDLILNECPKCEDYSFNWIYDLRAKMKLGSMTCVNDLGQVIDVIELNNTCDPLTTKLSSSSPILVANNTIEPSLTLPTTQRSNITIKPPSTSPTLMPNITAQAQFKTSQLSTIILTATTIENFNQSVAEYRSQTKCIESFSIWKKEIITDIMQRIQRKTKFHCLVEFM